VFDMIAQRIVKLTTEQRAPRRVELLQAAIAPKTPLQKLPMKMMLLASAAAMACPFLLAFAWEWRTQRLSDSHQLAVFSTVPVVAEIASFPARARSSHRALPRSVTRALRHFEESVHSLRTYLSLSRSLNDVRVLAVTSSISQEGKTSVAAQLALSFSRSSGRVLLIDGDLRAPDVHKMFDIERGPGLAEVLQGEVSAAEAIHTEWSADIHILPAGRLKCDPHQLIGSGEVEKLVAQLRQQYATIIIDTPPVLAASEALVLAKTADATLLCTMRDVSRLTQVKQTYNRLIDSGARPVGAVFSGVPMASYYRTYGDYEYAPHS
jgi:capsular exopolysaccharide synthesis family protein